MNIKDGFELVNRDGQDFIISNKNEKQVIPVSKYSVFLWNLLKKSPVTKNQMLESLLANYNISTVLALGEIDNFLRMLREYEIIE